VEARSGRKLSGTSSPYLFAEDIIDYTVGFSVNELQKGVTNPLKPSGNFMSQLS
jgi:hypothetical protein